MIPIRAALLAAALPGLAAAGTPYQEEMTCPVGGEVFEVTYTYSCTSFTPHFLSLAPQSSCDWVTHLPQCPGNRLPVYKQFTAGEIADLATLVGSPAYTDIADRHSRFFLAHWLDGELNGSDAKARFFLLLQGLWWDTATVTADPEHLAATLTELEAALPGVDPEEAPVYLGIGAYLSVLLDDFDAADAWLARANAAMEGTTNEFAASYLTVLGACVASGDRTSPLCATHGLMPE